MMYECMKDFELEKYDKDGFPTDEYMAIKKGSKWKRDDSTNIIGGVHLESISGSQWIEISKKTLNGYFRETTATNGKNGG